MTLETNLKTLEKVLNLKIYKTVGELRYDVTSWLECHIEELQNLKQRYSRMPSKELNMSKVEIIDEVLGLEK